MGLKRRPFPDKVINHARPQRSGSSVPENKCCQCVVKDGTGAESRGDLQEIGLELASKGGQVWVGTERGNSTAKGAAEGVHRGL